MLSNLFSFLFFDFSQGILYLKNTIDPKTLQQFYQMDKTLICILHFSILAATIEGLSKTSEVKWMNHCIRFKIYNVPTKNSTSLQTLYQNLQKDYVHASLFWDLQCYSSMPLSNSPEASLVEGNQDITLFFTGFTMSLKSPYIGTLVTSMIPTKYICSPRMRASASAYYYWLPENNA